MAEYKVGMIGLGIIGSIWAQHWLNEGMLSGVWNRTPKKNFPKWKDTLEALAEDADVLVICVADPPAVSGVLDRLEPILEARHTIVQSSTIDPNSSEAFAARVESCGASYLTAPFTGSKPAAEERKTVFYLGGDKSVIQSVEPVLKQVCTTHYHIGSNAQACTLKLAMNMQIAMQAEALSESLTFCRDAGISDDTFFDALRSNVAWSGLTALKEDRLRAADYSPQFSIKHMFKDMRLADAGIAEGKAPLLKAVLGCFQRSVDRGYEDEDFMALIKNLQD